MCRAGMFRVWGLEFSVWLFRLAWLADHEPLRECGRVGGNVTGGVGGEGGIGRQVGGTLVMVLPWSCHDV